MEEEDSKTSKCITDLETLKGRLEQQEAAKLKAEQIVSTLSRIKAREKATRMRVGARDDAQLISSNEKKPRKTPNSALKEKSNLLRRKLEEDRAKLEKLKESEGLDKVNKVVETIKAQLEDRDKLMQQLLLSGQQTSVQQISGNNDGDDSDFIISPAVNDQPQELPIEVKQKIAELEAKIIDLEENLLEKDEVISARTQALTLLSEDMSRKSKTTLDTLEETQLQMREMQNNFISIEEKMKEEHQRLKDEANDRKQRCLQAEKNLRIVEAARFDLSTRVAELREKVVDLQTRNLELENSMKEAENKQKEIENALEVSKSTNAKMKAKYKVKINALEKERNSLKEKPSMVEEDVQKLQEKIAQLEEEKEKSSLLKEQNSELEEKLKCQNLDLDAHVRALSNLETEKLNLVQVIQERDSMISAKDALINRLEDQLLEINRLKVSAEMRSIELEERFDKFIKDQINSKSNYENEISNLKEQLTKQENAVKELRMKLSARQNDILQAGGDGKYLTDLNSELKEWQDKYHDMEKNYGNANDSFKSLEKRLDDAEKQNESVVVECNELKSTISRLQESIHQNVAYNEKYKNSESSVGEHKQISDNKDLEIERLREELSKANCELQRLSIVLENTSVTGSQIDELNETISEKDKALAEINNELEKRTRKLSEYKKFHKIKSEDVLRVSHELETVSATNQETIANLEAKLESANKTILELQIKMDQCSANNSTKNDEQVLKIKKLAANVKLRAKNCKDLEEKLELARQQLLSKDEQIQEFIKKENNYLSDINRLKSNLKMEPIEGENNTLQTKLLDQQQCIVRLEQENQTIQEEREQAFSDLEKLHQTELSRNDSLFQNLEIQVFESKAEIESLHRELEEVTQNYEQAWAKLQEKEVYIEKLESDLKITQTKINTIESNSVELVDNLKRQLEILHERLCRAEELNKQFENYKNELESKLSFATENEIALRNDILDKTNANEELKQTINNFRDRNLKLEDEMVNLKDSIGRLQNDLSIMNVIREDNLHYTQQIELLNNELTQVRSGSEKIIADINEREKYSVESLENELKCFSDRCGKLENERNSILNQLENFQQGNLHLNDELNRLKEDYESKYLVWESERNRLEEKYSNLEIDFNTKQEALDKFLSERNKEINDIMGEQRSFVERMHSDFKVKEDYYKSKLSELEDYNAKLTGSLQAIESNAESLKMKLNDMGNELNSSKEECILLKTELEKMISMNSELQNAKQNCFRELEKEKEQIEALKLELLREKTKIEIDNVVKEAETKILEYSLDKMIETTSAVNFSLFKSDEPVSNTFDFISHPTIVSDQVNVEKLRDQLLYLSKENERLFTIVNSHSSMSGSMEKKILPIVQANLFSEKSDGNLSSGNNNEDGWNWGGFDSEAMEQAVNFVVDLPSSQMQPHVEDNKLALLQKILNDMETENKKLKGESKDLQLRCCKLVKKVKELKTQNEKLDRSSKERSVGFEDLDFAMQEELREQIDKLQKNLQESLNENKNWKLEKENYLRKIDVLTSGNDTLVDIKESLNIELAGLQKQNADFKQQISALEWKVEELMDDYEKNNAASAEFEEKINILAEENEGLMKIVENLKDQQKSPNPQHNNENTIPIDNQQKNSYLLENYQKLTGENEQMVNEIRILKDQINYLNDEITGLKDDNEHLKSYAKEIVKSEELNNLEKLEISNSVDRDKLNKCELELQELYNQNKILQEKIVSLNVIISELEIDLSLYKEEKETTTNKTDGQLNNSNRENVDCHNNSDNDKQSTLNTLSSATVLFGFGDDDPSNVDPFESLQKIESFKNVEEPDNLNEVCKLNEQVCELTTLLEEKETQLEMSKQSLDNVKIGNEMLQEEWSEKFEDLKNEQCNVTTGNLNVYVDVLNEAERKYKDALLSKEEEVAHLTCELSSKEQQLANIKKELQKSVSNEAELNSTIEKYKIEIDSLLVKLNDCQFICNQLEDKLKNASNLDKDYSDKLEEAQIRLIYLQNENENCVKIIQNTNEENLLSDQNYNQCLYNLQERDRLIFEKNKLLEEATAKIHELNSKNIESPVQNLDANLISPDVTCVEPVSSNEDNELKKADNIISKYKEMIKQRDFEIEKLMQTLGEAEERVIRAEEQRLSGLPNAGLKLRLDEALYTLHLRDIRCDELTHELMQLLEERDSLQLRLSTAIRMNEDLRRKINTSSFPLARLDSANEPTTPIITTDNSSSCTTRTSSIECNQYSSSDHENYQDSNGGKLDILNEKLGELHSIGYQKDLSLHQDRIKRHSEQMHLYSSTQTGAQTTPLVLAPYSSTQQLSTTEDVLNSGNGGGFFSWIFGSGTGSSNSQALS